MVTTCWRRSACVNLLPVSECAYARGLFVQTAERRLQFGDTYALLSDNFGGGAFHIARIGELGLTLVEIFAELSISRLRRASSASLSIRPAMGINTSYHRPAQWRIPGRRRRPAK